MHYYIVYRTTNQVNGKIYIGIHHTTNLDDSYIGSGKRLLQAIRKYGKCNFKREILFIYSTQKEARNKEKELVNEEFVSRQDTYNVNPGGASGSPGELNGMYGKTHTNKVRSRLSAIAKERTFSIETRSKISQANRGERNGFYGKQHTQETLQIISRKCKEAFTEERRNKLKQPKTIDTRLKLSQSAKLRPKRMWITDGIESKLVTQSTIPEGWYRGRSF